MTAARLRAHIAEKFGVMIRGRESAEMFAHMVMGKREELRTAGIPADGLPLFGAHIDPDWSDIAPHCFMATLSFMNRDCWLVTTNTARLYEFEGKKTLRWLFESCRLWYDQPELHAPNMRCDVQSDDPRMDKEVSAVIHVGTAWVHPSLRGNGLGKAMVALHRLEAAERLGDHQMFGTTVASKSGGFTGTTSHHGIATVCMFAPGDENGAAEVQHVRIWDKASIEAAARAVLDEAAAERALTGG